MFNAISGILIYKGSDYIRVENHGIEWEFSVPSRSVDLFGQLGSNCRVLAWLLHREDSMRLFGFVSESERAVFLELITVDGIGPKQAMKILGGIGPSELEAALDTEDLARLETIPGLGKKTAQKLVFSLKGRLPQQRLNNQPPLASVEHEDIVRALADLGYDRRRSVEVVKQLAAQASLTELPAAEREREIFRKAIVELSVS